MENSDTALKRENCKFAMQLLLFAMVFGTGLGLSIKFGLPYLAYCCVSSMGALAITFIGIAIGIFLLSLSLSNCIRVYCLPRILKCPFDHFCQDLKSKDEENEDYLFGYA